MSIFVSAFLSDFSDATDFEWGPGEAAIKQLAALNKITLPPDAEFFWSKCNKASVAHWTSLSFPDALDLRAEMIQLAAELDLHDDDFETDGAVARAYFSSGWVPIFILEHTMLCVDLNPISLSNIGQIVQVVDDNSRRFAAYASISALCEFMVASYKSGGIIRRCDDGKVWYLPRSDFALSR